MPHSYSSWSTYNKCAAKYKFSYIDKLPRREPSPQMARGTRIHESVENYLLGNAERLDAEAHKLNGLYMSDVRRYGALKPEHKFGLTKKFEMTEFDDPQAYLRGVIDLKAQTGEGLKLFEWKTGKMYEEHADQIHMYGMVGLIEHPKIKSVDVKIRYLDFGTDKMETYDRSQLTMMKLRWKDRLKQIDTDKTFAPNPSYMCRWCDFSRERGGPCKVA
jgi:hypothetical protein